VGVAAHFLISQLTVMSKSNNKLRAMARQNAGEGMKVKLKVDIFTHHPEATELMTDIIDEMEPTDDPMQMATNNGMKADEISVFADLVDQTVKLSRMVMEVLQTSMSVEVGLGFRFLAKSGPKDYQVVQMSYYRGVGELVWIIEFDVKEGRE